MNKEEFPWYDIINDDSLYQGDIIKKCPVIEPIYNNAQEFEDNLENLSLYAEKTIVDTVLLTQSCDLENSKIDNVIMCPVWSYIEFIFQDKTLKNKAQEIAANHKMPFPKKDDDDFCNQMEKIIFSGKALTKHLNKIVKGEISAYHMINKEPSKNMPFLIVDFHRIYSLPKLVLSNIVVAQKDRLRLRPPYREHLAQAFARYFMRVGLPANIKDFN